MIRLLRLRVAALRSQRDRGIALVTVIGLGMVLVLLSATIISVSVSGMQKSASDADASAALSAAYAGIEDYQSKLQNNNAYPLFGVKGSSFSAASTFPKGADDNAAFGYLPDDGDADALDGDGWQPVTPERRAEYRYEVDNSQYYGTGVLRVRATGRVGDVTRSVVADLKQDGFINYLYFTDYELLDPDQGRNASERACQPTHDWESPHDSRCIELNFDGNSVFDGPVRTNDTMIVCNSKFKSAVSTAFKPARSTDRNYKISGLSGCGAPVNNLPVSVEELPMPATNQELLQETRSDLRDSTVPRPGCLYTGPTTITLLDNGKMTVRSPWTKATQIVGAPASGGSAPAACGSVGTGSNQLGSIAGQTLDVPQNNVIFVQGVPRTSANPATTPDPNDWKNGEYPWYDTTKSTSYCSGQLKTGTKVSTNGNGVGYPRVGETPPSTSSTDPSYGCERADVFVDGTLSGNLTIAAENYVYVTDDLDYKNTDSDVLGLVGQQAVQIYNPVTSCTQNGTTWTGTYLNPGKTNRVVKAAILSVAHTFTVQNYQCGLRGNLEVTGSIAQKYRGAVATGNGTSTVSGYTKVYGYDKRLRYTAPPKFLNPVATSYGVSRMTETKTAFTPKGREIR